MFLVDRYKKNRVLEKLDQRLPRLAPGATPVFVSIAGYANIVVAIGAWVLYAVGIVLLFFGPVTFAIVGLGLATAVFALAHPRAVAVTEDQVIVLASSPFTHAPHTVLARADRSAVTATVGSVIGLTTVTLASGGTTFRLGVMPTRSLAAYSVVQTLDSGTSRPSA